MDLKDFIKIIILDIGTAIEEVRIETGENFVIADHNGGGSSFGGVLSFDIAVTQSAEGTVSGKASASVFGVGAHINGDSRESGQNVSRIKFDLMLHNHLTEKDLEGISERDKSKYSKARYRSENKK